MLDIGELVRMSPQKKDHIDGAILHEGKRKLWVGIGWIDDGPVRGDAT